MRIRRNIMQKSGLIMGTLSLALFMAACSKSNTYKDKIEFGDFTQSITETGELESIDERAFVMKRYGRYWYSMKIIGMLDHGTVVNVGDSIIQFDPVDVKKFIIDRQTRLENEEANLQKLLVQNSITRNGWASTLKSEEATFTLKKLEMDQSQFESDKIKKTKELEFKQAEISLNKVKKRIELSEVIAQNNEKIQRLWVKQIKGDIESAEAVLPQLTIRTPISGIFQIATQRRSREMLKIGDEVNFGNKIGNVPDLKWMKVLTTVNETDISKIALNQKVNVWLDALPDVTFEGKVSFISKLCRESYWGSKKKVFDVEVEILESDERLKPGMTVSCEIITAALTDVFSVPNNCIVSENGRDYIYVSKGVGSDKVEVRIGARNNTHSEVSGNIKSGQSLIPINEIEQQKND